MTGVDPVTSRFSSMKERSLSSSPGPKGRTVSSWLSPMAGRGGATNQRSTCEIGGAGQSRSAEGRPEGQP